MRRFPVDASQYRTDDDPARTARVLASAGLDARSSERFPFSSTTLRTSAREDVDRNVAFVSGTPFRGVLFLCVHNAARSQMAEGWARHLLPTEVNVWSAGSMPAVAIDPRAEIAMREVGIDISGQHPKHISEVPLDKVDLVISLCADDVCPHLPGAFRRLSWVLPDPAFAPRGGPRMEQAAFRAVRDELRRRIEVLGNVPLAEVAPA